MKKEICILLMLSMLTTAFAVEQGSFEEKASNYSWTCVPKKNLPNVLIIGDSISIGYTLQVREFLKGKANLYRPVDTKGNPINCGDSSKGVNELKSWLGDIQWDVIHFNWGLHDLKRVSMKDGKQTSSPSLPPRLSLDEYRINLTKCIEQLQKSGAKLVFATTTAYPSEVTPSRLPKDVVQYNIVAKEVVQETVVELNDLYALTVGRLPELQMPKNVNFTDKGSAVIAKQVASKIADILGIETLNLPKYDTSKEAFDEAQKLLRLGQHDDAIEAYFYSAALGKSSGIKARGLLKAAFSLSKIKEFEKSSKVLKDILEMQNISNYVEMMALFGLARNCHFQGDEDLAKTYLMQAASVGEIPSNLKKLHSAVQLLLRD